MAKKNKATVCLNMIVKNERSVITRCLQSVKPLIDYWIIVDTGSTDGTQQIIQEFMGDIPGELHERPWVHFEHNRNEVLQLARGKGDYLLLIDADEQLEGTFSRRLLCKDVYLVTIRTGPLITFQRGLLINNHLDWTWRGVLHETLKCAQNYSVELLQDVILSAETTDGHRSQDPEKHLKDAQTLEKALLDEPNQADYVYYLAQSYYNAENLPLALENYQKRAHMLGWDQHTFWAKYYSAVLQERLKKASATFIKSYYEAFLYRPTRAEPIYHLAQHFYTTGNYLLGYVLAQFGLTIPLPNDVVYVEHWVYSYGMLTVFINCALQLGKNEEARIACEKMANNAEIPESIRQQALQLNLIGASTT